MSFYDSLGQSQSFVKVEGNGNVTYDKIFSSTNGSKESNALTSLKPYRSGFQVFGVIEMSTVDCRSVQLEIWNMINDVFQSVSGLCNDSSNAKLVTFKTQTMAIIYFGAQEKVLRNLEIFFFSSKTGSKFFLIDSLRIKFQSNFFVV